MYFPRKSTVALAVAATFAGGAFTAANAGSINSNYSTYATEAVTSGQVKNIKSPSLAYQPNQVVASGNKFTIYIKLNGGATWKSAIKTAINSNKAAKFGGNVNSASASISSNNSVLAITFTPSQAYSKQAVFSLNAVNKDINLSNATALQKSGGKITADFAFVNGSGSTTGAVNYPSSSNAVDTANGTIADSQQAIKIHVVNSSNFTGNSVINGNNIASGGVSASADESAQISVYTTPPLTNIVTGLGTSSLSKGKGTAYADIGAVYLTNTPGVQLGGKASNGDYTVGKDVSKVKFNLSGKFLTNGQEKLLVGSDPSCSNHNYTSPTQPSSSSSVNLTASFSSGATARYPAYGCIKFNNSSSVTGVTQIPQTQPKITSLKVYNKASSSSVIDTLSSPAKLYNLTDNGAQDTLINYVPASDAPYMTYVRVANNSGLSAPVKVTMKGQSGNILGSGTLGKLAAGASQTYSAKQVEKAAGVASLSKNKRPQIMVTAPVPYGTLNAQAYLSNGNGGFTNMSANK